MTFRREEKKIEARRQAELRGAFVDDRRFWIQLGDLRQVDAFNDALQSSEKFECALDSAGGDKTDVTIFLKSKVWPFVVFAVALPACLGLAALMLKGVRAYGTRGYVYGMRATFAWCGAGFLTLTLAMIGAWLSRKPDSTPVQLALLKAVGLFGSGRNRFPTR